MSQPPAGDEQAEAAPDRPVQGPARRLVAWLRARPPVRVLLAVLADLDQAGGGLLAGGLAYAALFALLPAALLVIGIVGLVVNDPVRQARVLDAIGSALPPVRELVADALPRLGLGAAPASVLGFVALVWGASRFYASLDDAFARVFRGSPVRGTLTRAVRGVVAVALLVALLGTALAASSVASLVAEQVVLGTRIGAGTRGFWQVVSPLLTAAVFVLGCGALYRLVPARRIPLRALAAPAVVVGVVIAAFTELFTFIGPRLIGSASQFGQVVAAFFGLMVWLGTCFQALLVGAAWVRVRLDRPAG